MPHFAIHDGSVVVNVIVADTQLIAEEITALSAVETEGLPWTGYTLHGDEWRSPMPTPGVWEWDDAASAWIDVTPEPDPVAE